MTSTNCIIGGLSYLEVTSAMYFVKHVSEVKQELLNATRVNGS